VLTPACRLETLCHDAAEATDVPVENVLIFLEDGREVRDDIIQELWEKGEQDEQQVGSPGRGPTSQG
jgi:hypothetical protein